jgi:glycosyltransferase involved in cell wall biosynthesis
VSAPAEAHVPGSRLDRRWREQAERGQVESLPGGEVTVSCMAPLRSGGLGRHLGEILDAIERDGREALCVSTTSREAEGWRQRHPLGVPYLIELLRATGLPTSAGVRVRATMAEFDSYAGARLPASGHLIAFNSQALVQFRKARTAGFESLSLVAANPHIRRLARQHERARERYPLEGSWASRLVKRNLAEYELADRIYVSSRYTRESFLEQGFEESRLLEFPLTPDPRFRPEEERGSPLFEVVYVGSLSVHKGVPLLIDAVRRLPHSDLRLRLVGGWGTPGMRKFIERARAEDSRILVTPGDPLPHLRTARLCVHPAYEDGFAYAPAEALAAGVPVLVSEDTGMKDLIEPGRDGLVLPTGDIDALSEAIDAAYRGELLRAGPAGHG